MNKEVLESPNPWTAPPKPASVPEIIMDKIIVRLLLIPAYSEANGFNPTDRISKPSVVFHQEPHKNKENEGQENADVQTRAITDIC